MLCHFICVHFFPQQQQHIHTAPTERIHNKARYALNDCWCTETARLALTKTKLIIFSLALTLHCKKKNRFFFPFVHRESKYMHTQTQKADLSLAEALIFTKAQNIFAFRFSQKKQVFHGQNYHSRALIHIP